MGQRADTLGSSDPADDQVNMDPVLSADSAGDDVTQETAEIRAGIEQTRSEMSATIDAIQEKLNPQTLVEQAKESARDAAAEAVEHAKHAVREATVGRVENMVSNVTDTARDTGSGIMDMIRDNPIPAAIAGLGLGWFFLKGQNSSGSRNRSSYQGQGSYSGSRSMPSSGRGSYDTQSRGSGYTGGGSYSGTGQSTYEASAYTGGGQGTYDGGSYMGGQGTYDAGSYSYDSGNSGGGILDTLRENPVPTALAAVSLGWLLTRGGSQRGGEDMSYQNWGGDYGDQNWDTGANGGGMVSQAGDKVGALAGQAGDVVSQAGEKVGDIASQAGDKAGEVVSQAGDVVSQAGEKVGELASHAGDKVGDIAGEAQYQAYRARTQFQVMMMDNPLAVGAAALAVGAAIGLALPSTQPEQRLMGEARDTLVEKAQTVAHDTLDRVQQVAQDVGQTAKEAAQDVGQSAKRAAQDVGQAAKESVQDQVSTSSASADA